jgi:hypothetical protein
MLPNGASRVLVLSDTKETRARDRTSRVAYTAMSIRSAAFRASIIFGLATVVAAILWFTPPPRKYLRRPGLKFSLTDGIVIII